MKNSAKTPYEIRLDLLRLSFDILIAEAEAKAVADYNGLHSENIRVAKSPTTAEVIANAKTLNDFISTGT